MENHSQLMTVLILVWKNILVHRLKQHSQQALLIYNLLLGQPHNHLMNWALASFFHGSNSLLKI